MLFRPSSALRSAMAVRALSVGLNLVLPRLVTMVHHLEIEVEVVDEAGNPPVAGATVSWASSGHTPERVIGWTDESGHPEVVETIQAQPGRVLPKLGSIRLVSRNLHVNAPGYEEGKVDSAKPWVISRSRPSAVESS